jgi:uroporphyrinogen decarboxylase
MFMLVTDSIRQALVDPGSLQAYLKAHYGRQDEDTNSSWERVEMALAHREPDRVPFDFWAVPEVWAELRAALAAQDDEDILRLLGVDCRLVTPHYVGSKARELPDGTFVDAWGTHRRRVRNPFSTYDEYASHPLAGAETVLDVQDWDWPDPDDWDVSGVYEQCRRLNAHRRYHLRYEVGGIFEWSWGLRGFERFLLDLVEEPEVACAIMDRFTDLYIANTLRMIEAARGLLDMVYTYDDVGMQSGLLISPRMWRRYILPRHQRLNAAIRAAAYPVKLMYHSCGAIYPLIGALIDKMGIDVLNPLQPRAAGMDAARIKAEFGQWVSFHGAIDIQHTLPQGTPDEVQAEVQERCRILGRGGGYLCASAHYLQADTPLENIVAMYTAPRELPP